MRLALIGNCQLEILGDLIKSIESLHRDRIDYIFNTPIYKLQEKENVIDFYHELESCDLIFMQYHTEKWGAFSTATLSKYFDLSLVPTLESRVSTPQLGYFDRPLPDLMVYVDYRFLHLYLSGIPQKHAVYHYHDAISSRDKQLEMLREDTQKYRTLYQTGKLFFDYSEVYFEQLSNNVDCFTTVSHPDNFHLGILLQAIYQKAFQVTENFDLQGQGLLDNYRAPKLGSGNMDYFMMRNTGLPLASKINYGYFDSQNKRDLAQALLKSAYYQSLPDALQTI
jgi:hypothetical protein